MEFLFCWNFNLKVFKFYVRNISATVTLKLVFSKRLMFAFEERYFEKFCVLSIELFHPVHFVEVNALKRMLDFLYQI